MDFDHNCFEIMSLIRFPLYRLFIFIGLDFHFIECMDAY